MDAIVKMLEKHQPFFEKISRNIYLQAIKDGFLGCMPIVLTSSIFLLIATLPGVVGVTLPQPLIDWCNKLYNFTMGVMGIMVAGTTAADMDADMMGAMATHSNLRSICSHKRNVTEEMFRYIVEHKGLCGLNLLHGFVSDEPMKDSKAELFRHVYRMLELGGEDVIACGSDFDGGITSQMDNPALFASFGDYMVDHGISRRVSDKIMFENALHFFEENIK